MIDTILEDLQETLGILADVGDPPWDGTLEEWEEWFLEAPKDPVERAKVRMDDAYERGGFEKMRRATEIRIQAMKSADKLRGLVKALKKKLSGDWDPSQHAALKKLWSRAAHRLAALEERDAGQMFVPPTELKVNGPYGEGVPSHYAKTCSMDSFKANVVYFHKAKDYELKQAIAASYSALKKACGVEADEKMTPSAIVAKGSK